MSLSKLSTLALATGILCASAAPASAITNGTRPADDDLRFDAVAALSSGHFLGLDPDHPNAQEHNWWCTATLVTPEIALTAAHCITNPGAEGVHALRFRRHEDGSLGTKAAGPESFHHVWVDHFEELPGDALAIVLEEPVWHIAPIPVLMAGTERMPAGVPMIHAGWGKEGPGFDEGPRNELLLCENTIGGSNRLGIFFSGASGDGCGVNMHDSGSPVLFENEEGELRALGGVITTSGAVNYASFRDLTGLGFVHTPYAAPDLVVDAETNGGIFEPGDSVVIATLFENFGRRMRARLPARVDLVGTEGVVQTWYLRSTSLELGSWQRHVLTLAEDLPVGTYHFSVTADPFDAADEYFEFNNSWEAGGPNITVTTASGEVERSTISPVIFDDGSHAVIVTAERDDGTVAIVSIDPNGESYARPYLRPGRGGELRFKQNGRTYIVTLGAEVVVETTADDASIWVTAEYATIGSMGHIQGIYTARPTLTPATALDTRAVRSGSGFPVFLDTRHTQVVAIAMADGNVYMASTDGSFGAAGDTDRVTQECVFYWGSADAAIRWDPERETHRLLGASGRLRFDLELEIP